jgi:nitroimidazol reductase NimA-like FMN-containing flavoprotein (pyridoxamine 5'-phosphate oxidase superfamily)
LEIENFKSHLLMDENEETAKAKGIIKSIPYITLATSNREGVPWNTPLYFAHDNSYNFYWISSKVSVHSANIEENENVAIVIYDSTLPEGKGAGVYIKARAREVNEEAAIRTALGLLYQRKKKPVPKIDGFVGNSPMRVYMAAPVCVWVNDIKKKLGKDKETRIEIEL